MSDSIDLIFDGPEGAAITIALAHGAGAPATSPFMTTLAAGLGDQGVRVVRFNFPYMAEREITGKKRPPNPQRILLESWVQVIGQINQASGGTSRIVIGGKSMGGRMATLVARDLERADDAGSDLAGGLVAGVVALGYPFHPPGKPEKLRTAHLMDLQTPLLICQGERDTFGTKDEVPGFNLPNRIQFHWASDGDHSLKPRKKSSFTESGNIAEAVNAITEFLGKL